MLEKICPLNFAELADLFVYIWMDGWINTFSKKKNYVDKYEPDSTLSIGN